MSAYYNENEPYAAQWLRNLIAADLIAAGDVDERSIKDVQPDDLRGYSRCHFFAGIAGWELALAQAKWPTDREVWTGSCPCQPFSVAGKQRGTADERHLWPEFFRLIRERHPTVVFGEQVAAASQWLAGVRSDLEAVGYAVAAVPVEAASAGACQYRDRFWFVAGSNNAEWGSSKPRRNESPRQETRWLEGNRHTTECGSSLLVSQHVTGLEGGESLGSNVQQKCPSIEQSSVGLLERDPSLGWGEGWTESEFRSRRFTAAVASLPDGAQFIECPDGKWRRLPPPRVRWLGNGIPSRVAKLRAFGNAIYPPAAAAFITAYLECRP